MSAEKMHHQDYFYRPDTGHGLAHNPFNSLIAPRPIGWISSMSASGQLNLAPYSFFNAFNYTPPIIGFSSTSYKDSVRNIEATRQFSWSLVTPELANAMNLTSQAVDSEVNEFELAGLQQRPAKVIDVPGVKASPVTMECRATQIVQLQSAEGEVCESWLVLGEVVGVHIDTGLIEEGMINTQLLESVMRGGGPADYYQVGPQQLFSMHRPGN